MMVRPTSKREYLFISGAIYFADAFRGIRWVLIVQPLGLTYWQPNTLYWIEQEVDSKTHTALETI